MSILFLKLKLPEEFTEGPIFNIHAIITPKRPIKADGKGSIIKAINTLTKREKKIQPS